MNRELFRYLLHLAHAVACIRIEYVLDSPRQRPVNVPLLILLAFLPATLLKVLDEHCFVEVRLVAELGLCRLHYWSIARRNMKDVSTFWFGVLDLNKQIINFS